MLGRYKKRFLAYLDKENFDHTQGFVDPFEYHSCFVAFANLFSVMDYEKMPYWMYISPIGVAIAGVVAATMLFAACCNYVVKFQVQLIIESGTYFLIMIYKLLIISCTFLDKKHYHSLLKALRDDFKYICTTGVRYRDRFFENQKLTFKACVLSAFFTGGIGTGMSIAAGISTAWFCIIYGKDYGDGRPLMFPFWLFDYDMNATPTYEIVFFLCVFFTFSHTYTYIFMMQTQILWVREITCKADIVIWQIQDLLVDVHPARSKAETDHYSLVIRHRMRSIITMHHTMFKLTEDYASVYKKCLLYEQKLAAPIICMTAYCAAEKLDQGEVQGILMLLCIAVVVLVLIPSYLCTFLLDKVQSVGDACWDTPFWDSGTVVRPYLVLIMQRSMRRLPIVAAGFEDISLQTYSNIITRAYSCFNMLRQANFDIS